MTQFAIADPRTFDGNPYEVAARACDQASALAALLQLAITDAAVMVRNAEMERQLVLDGEPDAAAWDESAQARRLAGLVDDARGIERALKHVRAAASYDPKHPPKP